MNLDTRYFHKKHNTAQEKERTWYWNWSSEYICLSIDFWIVNGKIIWTYFTYLTWHMCKIKEKIPILYLIWSRAWKSLNCWSLKWKVQPVVQIINNLRLYLKLNSFIENFQRLRTTIPEQSFRFSTYQGLLPKIDEGLLGKLTKFF